MSDQLPEKGKIRFALTLKVLVASVCGLLLSLGLCGIDAHLHPRAEFGGGVFALFGVILLACSVLALVVSILTFVVQGILYAFRNK